MGFDIARRAGEQQAIHLRQQAFATHGMPQGRQNQRQSADRENGLQVLVAGDMVGVQADLANAGDDPDDWHDGHGLYPFYCCYGLRPRVALFIFLHNRAVKNQTQATEQRMTAAFARPWTPHKRPQRTKKEQNRALLTA